MGAYHCMTKTNPRHRIIPRCVDTVNMYIIARIHIRIRCTNTVYRKIPSEYSMHTNTVYRKGWVLYWVVRVYKDTLLLEEIV
jgi:hypothetical protein